MFRKLFLLVLLPVLLPLQSHAERAARQLLNFDFDWKFIIADNSEFSAYDLADTSWSDVQLPHDWNIEMDFDQKSQGAAYLRESVGWYRKHFKTPADIKGKKVLVHFEAIFHKSDVFINGQHLGFHPYGFTSIEYDLTPYLRKDGDNVIAVCVNCVGGRPRWYAGSGIYRHAYLKVVNSVHVQKYGTYVTTPVVTADKAEVAVSTTVENESQRACRIDVSQRVYSPKGKMVASGKSCIDAAATGENVVENRLTVANPQLWDIYTPQLYRLETEVSADGKLVDRYDTRFGVRTVSFDASRGFILNGRRVKLQGMCLHQDDGCLGTVLTRRSMERRLQILKEYGCNAIRCSHNQPATEFLDLCDSIGLVVIDEAFDKWRSGYYGEFFDDWWQKDMTDMITRDRNHPCIVLWSIGNELGEAWKDGDEGIKRATMLRDFVHQLEPTRLTTFGAQNNHKETFASVVDITGYNYLEKRMVSEHKKSPTRSALISEELPYYQGAEGNLRSYDTDNPWNTILANDFCAGGFIWSGASSRAVNPQGRNNERETQNGRR